MVISVDSEKAVFLLLILVYLPSPHLSIPSSSAIFFLSESIVDISIMLVSDIQHGDSNCL